MFSESVPLRSGSITPPLPIRMRRVVDPIEVIITSRLAQASMGVP